MATRFPQRPRIDLAGYWPARLELTNAVDVAVAGGDVIEKPFYLPLPWNVQLHELRWPDTSTEMSGVVQPVQNQNFRDIERKFNEGVITYSIDFELPAGWRDDVGGGPGVDGGGAAAGRTFLVCEGANDRTAVRLNGRDVGGHDFPHLGFEIELTDALADGRQRLDITVDNRRRRDACPQEQYNWRSFGGVYRELYVERRPATFIERVAVRPRLDDGQWWVEVTAEVNGAGHVADRVTVSSGGRSSTRVRSSNDDAGGLRSGPIAASKSLQDPLVWRPGVGGMSRCTVELLGEAAGDGDPARRPVVDRVEIDFGVRDVRVDGRRLLVNGEPVQMRGAAWHEQHATFGAAVPQWQVMHDIRQMKHVGLNAIRAAHYPHAPAMYDACDREGMLVVAELPCWQFDAWHFERPAVRDHVVDYASTMVRQLGNHPSIVGWVVQNEGKTHEPSSVGFFGPVVEAIRGVDGAAPRPIVSAESPHPPEHLQRLKAGDEAAREAEVRNEGWTPPPTERLINVLGVNCYAGWYHDKAEALPALLDRVAAAVTDKPLVVTEFGAEGIPGQRSLTMEPWTEDGQARLLERHLRAILDRPAFSGFFLWLFHDYECSSIGIRGVNAKGLVDRYRRPKLAYDVVRRLLTERSDD